MQGEPAPAATTNERDSNTLVERCILETHRGIVPQVFTILAMAFGSALVLALFFALVVTYPDTVRGSVSSALILASHLITYDILLRLDIEWPQTARQVGTGTIQALVELDLTAAMSPCIGLPANFAVKSGVMLWPPFYLFFVYLCFQVLSWISKGLCSCAWCQVEVDDDDGDGDSEICESRAKR